MNFARWIAALATTVALGPIAAAATTPTGLGCQATGASLVIESNVLTCKQLPDTPSVAPVSCVGFRVAVPSAKVGPDCQTFVACPSGYTRQTDYSGNSDKCVNFGQAIYAAPVNK